MTLPNQASLNEYGGVLRDALPIVDPTTEISAASLNNVRNDVSAMTATAVRCLFQFLGSASNPVLYSSPTWTSGFDSVWGSAPAGQPSMVRASPGVINVTLPSTVGDQLNNNNLLINIRNAKASVGGSTVGRAQVSITSASTFTIYLFNSAGSANDLVGSVILVEAY